MTVAGGGGAGAASSSNIRRPSRRSLLDVSREKLQLADSTERVLEIMGEATSRSAGFVHGTVFVVGRGTDPEPARVLAGPAADGAAVHEHELLGMARRAVREQAAVRQVGGTGGPLWAMPLGTSRSIGGVVAAVGEMGELADFFEHAGLALLRERKHAGEAARRHAAEARSADLERAVATLDAIAREGSTERVARRIVAAVSRVPELGRSGLWALRPEDGAYVEIATSGWSDDEGPDDELGPPVDCRRGEGFRQWSTALPKWSGFRWIPQGVPKRPQPGRGDALLVPLSGDDAPHAVGFLVIEIAHPLDGGSVTEDLHRWGTLARLALEGRADLRTHRQSVESLQEEKDRITELHRMKSQFIAAVSHELRTPLTSISAYAETLRSPTLAPDDENRDRFLKVIQDESRRLTRIVDDILDLATVDAGHVRLSCRTTSLADVVDSSFNVIRPIAADRSVDLTVATGSDAEVHGDPDLLKQLLVNLLENAVKFSPRDGSVRVRIEGDPSVARIVVEDEGPGIPASELDAIFERFYQVDGSRTREHGGSGLGLAICRSIATWHDGRIWAESDDGRGARLVVSLPRARATSRKRANTPPVTGAADVQRHLHELVTEMVAEVMGAETVSLMRLDRGRRELVIQAAIGLSDAAIRAVRVAVGERISGSVAETGDTLFIPDLAADERFESSCHTTEYRTRSLLSVPVILRDEIVGVLNVTNKLSGDPFDDHDRRLLEILAQRVALVLGKLREPDDARERVERMEEALRGIIDARRHYFPSGEDFSRLVVEVCEERGLDPDETAHIHYASILRDVGMTRLPEGVYKKPAELSDEDRELIRRHPEEGAKVLRSIEFLPDVFDIILSHHEEPDGTGYPRGLTETRIPIGARILGVIDAYHALRTGRPWRKPVTREDAIEELRRCAGKQFDQEIVESLVKVLESHRTRERS